MRTVREVEEEPGGDGMSRSTIEPKAHEDRHPNDVAAPRGMKRVRLDGGDAKTPVPDRVYAIVRAGYGEAARCRRARVEAA
jgi:hypothetical protein